MATITTTAIQQETPLRKRSRRHEIPSIIDIQTRPSVTKVKEKDVGAVGGDVSPPSPTDSGGHVSNSNDEYSTGEEPEQESFRRDERMRSRRPTLDTAAAYRFMDRSESSPMSPTTRAWYEFDLAVVVALVSPVGNWLTGGDHIKNLLLILLLIFYLHQIIEIPWSLYQKCRPHRRAHHLPPSGALEDPSSPEQRYARIAGSELQKLEFCFLLLTFFSPFIGATFLRYMSDAILGPGSVSWFSTGLFVLATGMRPWAHLVDRLNQRVGELHDFVHYPSASLGIADSHTRVLEKRIAHLEKSLSKIKNKVSHATEDVYEYVDSAVDAVEYAMRKQEEKWNMYEGKVNEVEQVVGKLSSFSSSSRAGKITNYEDTFREAVLADLRTLKAYIHSIFKRILPAWLLPSSPRIVEPTFQSSSGLISQIPRASGSKRIRSPSLSPSDSPTPVEFPKEDKMSKAVHVLTQPYSITSGFLYNTGYVITMPLRAIVRMVLRNY